MKPHFFQGTPFVVDSYVLMTALGLVAMGLLAHWRAREVGLDRRRVFGVFLSAALSGLIGARLGYVALHWAQYRQNPVEILRLTDGGMVWYTALFLGTCGAVWAVRRVGLPLWKTLDLIAAPTAMMRVFGRTGCFLSGCCGGVPSQLPWAIAFPPEVVGRHPAQLYEAGGILLIFFILKWLERRGHPVAGAVGGATTRPGAEGVLPCVGFILYGGMRFFLEWVRADALPGPLGFSIGQWLSLALFACGAWLLRRRLRVSHPV